MLDLTHAAAPQAAADPGGALRAHLRDYYGRRLTRSSEFTQAACCTDATAARMYLLPL